MKNSVTDLVKDGSKQLESVIDYSESCMGDLRNINELSVSVHGHVDSVNTAFQEQKYAVENIGNSMHGIQRVSQTILGQAQKNHEGAERLGKEADSLQVTTANVESVVFGKKKAS